MPRPRPLVVGLVNNMSDGALRTTEEQFNRLLQAACPQTGISIELFSCRAGRRRGNDGRVAIQAYRDVTELFSAHVDALIVTGMEPQAAHLQDEPAWACLTRIADWAQETAVPVIWSCLAAHAAVFYLDGIRRSRLSAKLSGVFDCERVAFDHPLTANLPGRWKTPHSRYNGLSEASLVNAGYRILSRSNEAGVDSFLRPGSAPHIFFQGHPEYDAGTLLCEYTRDVRRYLVGQQDEYPHVPRNYLEAPVEAALEDRRQHALSGHRDIGELEEVLRLTAGASKLNPWSSFAVPFYANWIERLLLVAPDRRPAAPAMDFHDVQHAGSAILGKC